jgi:hypothetical protein
LGGSFERRVSLSTALFFVLLAATLVTAILVVRARTPDLVLEVTSPPANANVMFSPIGGPPPHQVELTFFVREADDHALVAIVDSHEQIVRTLDSDVALQQYDPVTYVWDGRTDAGDFAVPGRYRLRVDLPSADREMIWPRRFTVVDSPPEP